MSPRANGKNKTGINRHLTSWNRRVHPKRTQSLGPDCSRRSTLHKGGLCAEYAEIEERADRGFLRRLLVSSAHFGVRTSNVTRAQIELDGAYPPIDLSLQDPVTSPQI